MVCPDPAWSAVGTRKAAADLGARRSFARQNPSPPQYISVLSSPNPSPPLRLPLCSSSIWVRCPRRPQLGRRRAPHHRPSKQRQPRPSPYLRSRWLLGADGSLPGSWWRLDADGPLTRTWWRLSSGNDSPNHRWSRQGRGNSTIVHQWIQLWCLPQLFLIHGWVSVPPFTVSSSVGCGRR